MQNPKTLTCFIDDPCEIAVINAVREGKKPMTELYNLLNRHGYGRRSAQNAMEQLRQKASLLTRSIQRYMQEPLKCEFEFLCMAMGIQNGRKKHMFKLNDCIEVEQHGHDRMVLHVDLSKLESIPTYDPDYHHSAASL